MHSRRGAIGKIRTNFTSFEDVLIFAQIVFLITLLPLIMKLLSLPALLKMLTPEYRKGKSGEMEEKIIKYTDYIFSRNFWIYRTTCLKRSLILYHFLRKDGINVQLCFGVRYSNKPASAGDKELEGHAWLMYEGDMYLENNVDAASTYKVTYCFPSDAEGEQNA